jgi:ubiquinone/menaquinone biosynthesis C-methylase UbiE
MSIKELAPTYYTRLHEVIQEVDEADMLFNAGCGDGLYDSYLKKNAKRIVSLEINRGDIRIAASINPQDTVAYCVGSIEQIPCRSNIFDCVICAEVLEHLEEDDSAVRELVRVLKKGGRLVVTVPSRDFPLVYDPINCVLNRFGKHVKIGAWSWGHERLYTAKALEDNFGLTVVRTKYLSHTLVGLLENSYVNSFAQRFIKNDPRNRGKVRVNIEAIKRSVSYKPPKWLTKIRDFVIWLDNKIFSHSKTSIGIMQVFEK